MLLNWQAERIPVEQKPHTYVLQQFAATASSLPHKNLLRMQGDSHISESTLQEHMQQ